MERGLDFNHAEGAVEGFWAELVGGAVGVAVGYLASEAIGFLRRNSENRINRQVVRSEVQVVKESLSKIRDQINVQDGLRSFSSTQRPQFTTEFILDRRLLVSSGYSAKEIDHLSTLHGNLTTILHVWDILDRASTEDRAGRAIVDAQTRKFFSNETLPRSPQNFKHLVDGSTKTLGQAVESAFDAIQSFSSGSF